MFLKPATPSPEVSINNPNFESYSGAQLWLGGGFNFSDIDLQQECVTAYPTNGAKCSQLLTVTKDAFLTQMVTEPTRIGESIQGLQVVHILLGAVTPERETFLGVTTGKYLGMDISSSLLLNDHINRIVKKASIALGCLRRNLRIRNSDTKAAAYSALVRPGLEYYAAVWSPHTDKT